VTGGDGAGQRLEGGFGRAVGDIDHISAETDVDEMLRMQPRPVVSSIFGMAYLQARKGPAHVDRHGQIPHLDWRVDDIDIIRRRLIERGSVVVQNVETAKAVHRLLDDVAHGRAIGHIGGEDGAGAPAADTSAATASAPHRRDRRARPTPRQPAMARALPARFPSPPPVTMATRPPVFVGSETPSRRCFSWRAW